MSRWSGHKDSGQREFTPQQYKMAVMRLQAGHVGLDNGMPMEDIADRLGLPNRTLRAIISEADGVDFILGAEDDRYFLAEYADHTDHQTRKLLAQAQTMIQRAARRKNFAAKLPRIQQVLI